MSGWNPQFWSQALLGNFYDKQLLVEKFYVKETSLIIIKLYSCIEWDQLRAELTSDTQ